MDGLFVLLGGLFMCYVIVSGVIEGVRPGNRLPGRREGRLAAGAA